MFLERHDVVTRKQCGKLDVFEKKQRSIERAVAYHLGALKRAFQAGDHDDKLILNMDETQFVVKMDDNKTLEKRGASAVKYHDVVSGGEGMTLVVLLRGGQNGRVETGPRGWMDRQVFAQWLAEDRCVRRDAHGMTQVVYLDNAAGHNENGITRDILQKKSVQLCFLPPRAPISANRQMRTLNSDLKRVRNEEWEKEKLRRAMPQRFSNMPNAAGEWSGKLQQPGKRFFLKLVAH
ncbi:hypothetical protein PybrP1_012005 [[Pythium] brassicae (nom. inval.)]|nr:hypothetical protein PybrP1_012005 [[Pythium] brassicae (nom. inval.)]